MLGPETSVQLVDLKHFEAKVATEMLLRVGGINVLACRSYLGVDRGRPENWRVCTGGRSSGGQRMHTDLVGEAFLLFVEGGASGINPRVRSENFFEKDEAR